MRVRDAQKNRGIARIACRIFSAIALCSVTLPSMAADLVHSLPHVWVSATALSLTLATAATRPKQ